MEKRICSQSFLWAQGGQGACGTERLSGIADGAAVQDQRVGKPYPVRSWDLSHQVAFYLYGVGFFCKA